MDWQTAREPLASLFYNRRHHIAKQQHAVERTRELFAKALATRNPRPGDYAIARHFLQHEAALPRPIWFLHATTRDDKHWPETRWQELLDLLADSGVHIAAVGPARRGAGEAAGGRPGVCRSAAAHEP